MQDLQKNMKSTIWKGKPKVTKQEMLENNNCDENGENT